MADSFVRVPADSVGKKIDATSLDVGADTVYRQRVVIGDNAATAEFATVTGGILQVGGTFNISTMPSVTVGNNINVSAMPAVVIAAGANNIGLINHISRTVTVVGVVSLAAGSVLDSISATVGVKGQVSLGPGTSNIGSINNISATVIIAMSNQTLQGISTTVTVTGVVTIGAGAANIGVINNISATVAITGTVALVAGTANIGAVSLAAGTANIGSINNISATVTAVIGGFLDPSGTQRNVVDSANLALRVNVVSGGTGGGAVGGEIANGASLSTTNKPVLIGGNDSAGGAGGIARTLLVDTSGRLILGAGAQNIGAVSLAAGTAKVGFIGKVSATVIVAMSNQTLQGISTTVTVTGVVTIGAGANNIGTINDISRTVAVVCAGTVAVSASVTAGNLPILCGGTAKRSVSATAFMQTNWLAPFGEQVIMQNRPPAYYSASRGPKCVTCSTSAAVALVAAPGAGLCLYVTGIMATNGSSTLTRGDIYAASQTGTPIASVFMAANGGGFVREYKPNVKVLSNTALNVRVKPSVSQCIFEIQYYVSPK